jgi:predicted transcriptional regulator
MGTVILTVRLDEALHRQLRHISVEQRESLQAITERLLREFVKREQKSPRKGARR